MTFGEDHPSITASSLNLQTIVLPKLRVRWQTYNRTKTRFEKNNEKLLQVVECLVNPVCQEAAKIVSTPGGSRGRPALPFIEMGRRA